MILFGKAKHLKKNYSLLIDQYIDVSKKLDALQEKFDQLLAQYTNLNKGCTNCKHLKTSVLTLPCAACEDFDRWEATE